jgi:hypothetical protein
MGTAYLSQTLTKINTAVLLKGIEHQARLFRQEWPGSTSSVCKPIIEVV